MLQQKKEKHQEQNKANEQPSLGEVLRERTILNRVLRVNMEQEDEIQDEK